MNDKVFVVAHELHSGKPLDLITVETPLEGIVDIIQGGVVTELGGSDSPFNSSVLAVVPLPDRQERARVIWPLRSAIRPARTVSE